MNERGVKLFFAGDFCSKPTSNFITVSEDLRDLIQSCDINVINYEVPLKPDHATGVPNLGKSYEHFYQNDDTPRFLKDLGFNLFSMANNHAFDWGLDGYNKTKSVFGDALFGLGSYEEAYKVKTMVRNNIKIGFLALSYAANFGVFDDVSHHEGYGCAYINDLKVNHIILEAKKNVDYLFVLPHDGIEYIDVPLPEIIARYRDFVDYGADAVIGTHPHCPQGWEEYHNKPIFYSLGNFFFNSKEDTLYRAWNRPHWYDGLCVVIKINGKGLLYSIVNTKNTDNISISIDKDNARERYNELICRYIVDKDLYAKRLKDCLENSISKQDLLLIDNTFHKQNLGLTIKRLIKKIGKVVFHKDNNDDDILLYMLKNPTRCNGLKQYISNR